MIRLGEEFKPHWVDIELGSDSLKILVRRPTMEEQYNDMAGGSAVAGGHLALIEDWEGVADADGNPLPYSIDNLRLLAGSAPGLFRLILVKLGNEFVAIQEETRKKPDPPSSESSEENSETETPVSPA